MKRYRVQVNGKVYDVGIEEADGSVSVSAAPSHPSAPAPVPADSAVQTAAAASGDEVIVSPMPGKIVSIAVKKGQAVKEGDLILVLEAMKMENEIYCGRGGTVKEIAVSEGATVNTGDTMAIVG